MQNTRFTVESETHIATFEVVGYDEHSVHVIMRSTYTMTREEADFAAGCERARELTSEFRFGITAQPILRQPPAEFPLVAWTTVIGNQTAVLMSLAKKETA
jgi:hypothetical protein